MTLNGQVTGSLPAGYITTWSQVGGPSIVITNPHSLVTTVTGFTAGQTYTFRLTTTCLDGVLTYDDVRYTVQSHTIANAGADGAYCPGTNVGNLGGNAVGANENGAWTIQGTNGAGININFPTSPTSSFTLAATSSGQTTLRWTISNSNGCSSYDEAIITNYGGVTPVNAGPDQVLSSCFSTTTAATLAATFGGNNVGGQRGQWILVSGPNNPTFSNVYANNSTISNLIPGVYVLRWVVAGPCANGSDEVTITVPVGIGSVTSVTGGSTPPDQVFCDYRTTAILTGPTPLYINETSLWSYVSGPSGAIVPVIADPTNPVTQVTFTNPLTGRYRFRYTITNNLTGCSNTDGSVDITFNQNPSIAVNADLVLPCNTTFGTVSGTQVGSGTPQYRYVSWPSGFTPPNTNWNDVTTSSGGSWSQPLNNLNNAGTYYFQVRKSSGTNNGCGTVFDDFTVTVSKTPSTANAGTDQILACNVTSTNLVGNVPAVGIGTWYQVSGPNSATIGNIHQNNTSMSNLIPGLYRFRWVINAGPICPSNQDDVILLVVSATPTQANAGFDEGSCYGTPYTLQGNSPSFTENGTWTVSPSTGITFSPNANNPHAVVTGLAASTAYRFIWTITNACGSTKDTVYVTTTSVLGAPVANAGTDGCFSSGTTSVALNGNNPAPGTGLWTAIPSSGITFSPNANTRNATANGLTDGTYKFVWSIAVAGCDTTRDTVMVTISAPVTPANAGPEQQICATSTTLAGNIPAIGTGLWAQMAGPPGVTINNPALNNSLISFTYEGSYVFYWTISNGACTSSVDSVSIVVNLPPQSASAGKDSVYCNITTLPVTMNLYATPITSGSALWTFISGPTTPTIADPSSPTSQLSQLQAGTYTLRWSVFSGPFCPPSTDDIQISVIPKANAGTDAGFCDITEIGLTGNAGTTGTWTQVSGPAATLTANGPNTAVASGLTNNSVYKFRYAMSAGSCVSADTVQYTISAPATNASAGIDLEYCQPILPVRDTFYLAGNTPGGSETGTWARLSGPVTGTFYPSANSPNAKFVPGGTTQSGRVGIYIFTWTITNGSCTSADQLKVTNYARPSTANAGPDQTIACDTFAIMAATAPTSGLGIWLQVAGPIGPIIQAPYSPTSVISNLKPVSYPTTYKFLWTVFNGVCTPSTDTVYVVVYEKPAIPNAGPDQNLCDVTSATMQGNVLSHGTGTWSQVPGGPSTATIENPSSPTSVVDNLTYGTYRFVWTSSQPPCALTDTVKIVVYQSPTVSNAGEDRGICQFDLLYLNANTPVVGSGLWSQFSGPNSANILNPASPTSQVIGIVLGTYRFIWTITNGTCPASRDTVTITVFEIPTMAIAGPDMRKCDADSVRMAGNVPDVGTGTWSKVSGSFANIINPGSPVTDVKGLTPGTYIFEWKIINGICISKDSMQLIVDELVLSNAGPNQTLCGGTTSTSMSANSPSPGTGLWRKASGPSATIVSPTSNTTQITGLSAGTYDFRWIITNGLCKDSSDVFITIFNTVNYGSLASGDETLCYDADPANIIFQTTPSGGAGTFAYQWYYQDGIATCPSGTSTVGWTLIEGATSNSYNPPSGLTASRTYAVIVDVTGSPDCGVATWANGCRKVTVYNPVTYGTVASGDQTLCYGGDPANITLTNLPGGGAGTFSYQWYYKDGINECPSGTVNTGWTSISGATTNSYDPPSGLTVSRTFALMVDATGTPDCGPFTWSTGCRQITVYPNVSYGTLTGGDEAICFNGNPSVIAFSSLPSGGSGLYSYQWYYQDGLVSCPTGTDISAWNLISGATSDNYDPPAGLTASRTYAVVVDILGTPDCGPATWATGCRKVTVIDLPTITPGTSPAVCKGLTSANLPYSATTGSPDLYSIVYDATALAQGFVNVTDAPLPASPVLLALPPTAAIGVYSATLTVTNSTTGCSSTGSPFTVALEQCPSISLEKTGTYHDDNDPAGYDDGDYISYVFVVTNTGNVTLTNVTVTDPKVTVYGEPISLAPGETNSTHFTGTYTLTQADIDAGTFTNTATVNGTPPVGPPVTDTDDDVQTFIQSPSISLEKTGTYVDNNPPGIYNTGDQITYVFNVVNTGNVTLTSVTVSDPKVIVSGAPITLAPGQSNNSNFTGTYTLTQADIDNGTFTNTATTSGTPPVGPPVTDSDDDVQSFLQEPSISLEKTGTYHDDNDPAGYDAGDYITYVFVVTNTGNVTLTNVTVSDPKVTVIGSPVTLAPGQLNSSNFTGTYTLTQADIDAGTFTNTATTSGTPPSGPPVTDSDDDVQNFIQEPSVTLVKTGTYHDDNSPVGYDPGDFITYVFVVTNTGNVTLTNVVVTDPEITVNGDPITLAPGQSDNTHFTGSYNLTQADIDAGSFTNIASVSGTPPTGSPVTDEDDDTQYFGQVPTISLEKTGTYVDNPPVGIYNAGDQITYTFLVVNTGNVTLTNVTVTDPKIIVTGSPITLAPGESNGSHFTGIYTLTQANIDSATFTNIAAVSGNPPAGPPVTDTDDDTQNFVQTPSILLEKTGTYVDNAPIGIYNPGDQITYTFTVTNTGNVTLINVTVSDPLVTVNGDPITLAPGDMNNDNFTGIYTLTQADIDEGSFTNTATTSGQPPFGPPVTDDDDDVQPIVQEPGLVVTKSQTGGPNPITDPGQVIDYTITVENTGNVTLTDVNAADILPDGSTGTLVGPFNDNGITDAIDVDETWTYTISYTVQPSDMYNPLLINTVTVSTREYPGPESDTAQTVVVQFEMGDAPEGSVAYPDLGVTGNFPTCINVATAGYITHDMSELWFGPHADYEAEGNGGLCAAFSLQNHDEFDDDGDAGLLMPTVFSIINSHHYYTKDESMTPLGEICDTAIWGVNIDIEIHNHTESQAYVNVLFDWNRDGNWAGDPECRCYGTGVPEHVLVNFPIPPDFNGNLSSLMPPGTGFHIGPEYGYIWVRFSITERPVRQNWNGSGAFRAGETEDYLLMVNPHTKIPVANWAVFLAIGLMVVITAVIYRRRSN